jgi:diguanylate cyclase (GGDEF)-like protein
VPTGQLLTPEVWAKRHRGIVWLLWLHVGGVVVFALIRGTGLSHALTEVTPIVVAALAASHPALGRRARSTAAVLGLVTASAVIVHLSGGVIEAHFHSVLGLLDPHGVFNHDAALRSPWKWALIHGAFVLAASVAYVVNWRLSERQAVEISRLVSRLEGLARTDPLTGVPNRRVWEEELPRELERARRMGTGVCVAMIDLDNFKSYNDSFGHQAGDLVLKEAASAWRAEVRSTDLLARYGGEEFVLLLPACALEDAIRIVERLRVVTPLVTCSVGLACWDFQEAGDRLVERADQALYAAKAEGRNRHVLA